MHPTGWHLALPGSHFVRRSSADGSARPRRRFYTAEVQRTDSGEVVEDDDDVVVVVVVVAAFVVFSTRQSVSTVNRFGA